MRVSEDPTKLRTSEGSLGYPDPSEGLGDRLGRKCTVRPECRRTSNWLNNYILTCVNWKSRV